ncbi:uncharacterized protein LOC124362066 isoform X2 [Homalodisca vitripennis]|uniref:uncharacterized protein LOC124362066 isoform X2 n=1 Tax=Homalodisca vitripennis TaxID=197043 RepID=UPI001EEBD156|nr:uncharacterized protein LOC124362066 isoform X2 [Homalodisca vitripennis]
MESSSHSNEVEADSGLYVRKPRCTNPQHSPEVRVEYIPNYMAPGVQQARRQQQPAHVLNHRPSPSDRQNPASSASKVVMPVQTGKVQATSFNPESRTWMSHPGSSLSNRDAHVLRGNPNPDGLRRVNPLRNSNAGQTNYRNLQAQNSNSSVASQFRRPNYYNHNRNFQSRNFDINKVRNVSVSSFNSGILNRNIQGAQPKRNITQTRGFVWPHRQYITQPNPSEKKSSVVDNQNGAQNPQQAYNLGMNSPHGSRRFNIKVKPEVITHINRPYQTLQHSQ